MTKFLTSGFGQALRTDCILVSLVLQLPSLLQLILGPFHTLIIQSGWKGIIVNTCKGCSLQVLLWCSAHTAPAFLFPAQVLVFYGMLLSLPLAEHARQQNGQIVSQTQHACNFCGCFGVFPNPHGLSSAHRD